MEQNDLSFIPRERRLEIDKILREREKKPEDFNIENGVLVKYLGSSDNVIIPDSVTSIGVKAFS